MTGAITAAAILMFVGTASGTVRAALYGLFHIGGGPDQVAAIALILNIALILIAWGRHKDAQASRKARTAAEERACLLQTRDVQTDLLNRNSLRERTSVLIQNAWQQRGSVALMVVNLNRFKKINEVYGEAVGDGLLRIIAAIILNNAPRHALCARLGSDEFAIAIPFEEADEDRITAFAEDLLRQLDLPAEVMGVSIRISASIGLARLGFGCTDFTALLRRADIAMNAAKEKKARAPVWFDSRMESDLCARHEVEIGLRRGIPLGEFVPYFQPQVEFGSGRIRGMEMLARWNHPAGGVINPDIFIPVAEECGLIGELSERLMRAAFEEAKAWDPSITLSVNISPKQLTDPSFAQKMLKLLNETGFPPARLEVEMTESSLFENLELAQTIVASLKNQGVRLALDDFGTGYSSLAHLRALPFDRIKIDRSFTLTLNKDPESWTIVKAIANLGESLGVPITIEGVESAAIELRVRSLGCELGQGWFFGVPVPAVRTRQLLAEYGLYGVEGEAAPSPTDSEAEDLSSRAA